MEPFWYHSFKIEQEGKEYDACSVIICNSKYELVVGADSDFCNVALCVTLSRDRLSLFLTGAKTSGTVKCSVALCVGGLVDVCCPLTDKHKYRLGHGVTALTMKTITRVR